MLWNLRYKRQNMVPYANEYVKYKKNTILSANDMSRDYLLTSTLKLCTKGLLYCEVFFTKE